MMGHQCSPAIYMNPTVIKLSNRNQTQNKTFCMRVCARSLQSCPTLCNPLDCSPPGLSVHGVSQARILEWVAMPFSRGSSWPRDQTCITCVSSTAGGLFTTKPPGKSFEAHQFSSVAQLCPTLHDPGGPQHARPPCPPPIHGVYSNSSPLSW